MTFPALSIPWSCLLYTSDTIDMTAEKAKDMSDMVKNAVAETAKAVENAVESSMSTTIEDDDI